MLEAGLKRLALQHDTIVLLFGMQKGAEMTPLEKRWLEVQVYNNLLKIYHKNNDIQDVVTIIELLGSLFHLPTEQLKLLATKMLYNLRTRPTKKEYAIIAAHFKVPIVQIALHTGYTTQYLYNKIKTWNLDMVNIYHNEYSEKEYELMQDFINTSHKLKEWLI